MKKDSNKFINYLFGSLLLCFIVIYFSEITGYYEYQNHKKTTLTEEQIKKFENAVKNGEKIDLETYIVNQNINYDNKLSKIASKVSSSISNVVKLGIEKTFVYISKMIDE